MPKLTEEERRKRQIMTRLKQLEVRDLYPMAARRLLSEWRHGGASAALCRLFAIDGPAARLLTHEMIRQMTTGEQYVFWLDLLGQARLHPPRPTALAILRHLSYLDTVDHPTEADATA